MLGSGWTLGPDDWPSRLSVGSVVIGPFSETLPGVGSLGRHGGPLDGVYPPDLSAPLES